MDCHLPPPLTDEQLMSTLDGEEDATVQQHLANCPGCMARLKHIQEFEMELKSNLSRQTCCTPDELSDYALDLLDAEHAQRVKAHLDTCVRCREELADFHTFLKETEDPTPVEIIQPAVVYRKPPVLNRWTIQPLAGAAPPVRGKINRVISGEADTGRIQIIIEIGPDAAGITLNGAVLADDQASWAYALFTVTRSEELLALATLNPDGAFTCGPFPTGPFNIQITSRNGNTLVLENIE